TVGSKASTGWLSPYSNENAPQIKLLLGPFFPCCRNRDGPGLSPALNSMMGPSLVAGWSTMRYPLLRAITTRSPGTSGTGVSFGRINQAPPRSTMWKCVSSLGGTTMVHGALHSERQNSLDRRPSVPSTLVITSKPANLRNSFDFFFIGRTLEQ